ncbi:MAG: TIR domain-containing protein [Betaproteobacteria bacterium]|nr:TIR domain-containing protein [Betaproteobacteria bacterium]
MKTVFLSYSSHDYFFAEMLALKLGEAGFQLWRDQGAIRAGDDWRQTIEEGIRDSLAVIVALSTNSAESAYVTYEWAYATGMGKPVVPVKLSECRVHPKLEPTQYIDFSYPRALPWEALIDRLNQVDVEVDADTDSGPAKGRTRSDTTTLDVAANEILDYLNTRGFTMASFERLRQKLGSHLTDDVFQALIESEPARFRRATIKGGKPGIAKRVP